VVPLELQRRIVNDLVKHRGYWLVITLCAVYAGTVLVQGGTKLVLNLYRSWIGERATRDLRRRIQVLVNSPSSASSGSEAQGIQASMIVAEVEPIGGFVGASVSEPLLQGGVMISVLAYMIRDDEGEGCGHPHLLSKPSKIAATRPIRNANTGLSRTPAVIIDNSEPSMSASGNARRNRSRRRSRCGSGRALIFAATGVGAGVIDCAFPSTPRSRNCGPPNSIRAVNLAGGPPARG
jgi:hypothetical protein